MLACQETHTFGLPSWSLPSWSSDGSYCGDMFIWTVFKLGDSSVSWFQTYLLGSGCNWRALKEHLYFRDKTGSRTPVQLLRQFSLGNECKVTELPSSLTPGIVAFQPRPT